MTELKQLRDFAEQVNGVRPTERSLKGVVNNLIKNYQGGGSGGTSLYVHKISIEFLDGCGDTKNYEIKLLSSSNEAITIDTFKGIFNFVGGEEETTDPHMALNIIQCLCFDESENMKIIGEMLYYEADDRFEFAAFQSSYIDYTLTLSSVEDKVSPAI